MSFTTNIKNEISKENVDMIASRAELSAILRNSYNKTTNSLDLVLEKVLQVNPNAIYLFNFLILLIVPEIRTSL